MNIKSENEKPIIQKQIKKPANEMTKFDEIDKLRKELEDEKTKNKKLQETINNLNNTIKQLKQKDNNEIEKYKKEIKKKKEKIMNDQIKKFSLENTNLKDVMKKINAQNNSDELIRLYKKIEELNEKLSRYPFILEKNEKILSVIFASSAITYSIVCKNTDSIYKLEEELYKALPQLAESNNYFLYKGNVLNRLKKLKELNFKNGDIILLQQNEN